MGVEPTTERVIAPSAVLKTVELTGALALSDGSGWIHVECTVPLRPSGASDQAAAVYWLSCWSSRSFGM